MSLKQQSWVDFLTESSTKPIKDETFECEIIEISSPPTNNIDYTIIDQLHPNNHHSVDSTSLKEISGQNKKPRKKPATIKRK
jgi:hypothetical protein